MDAYDTLSRAAETNVLRVVLSRTEQITLVES